jgi:hypothetical protein
LHFRFSFEPRFSEVDKSLFLAPPLRTTSCNVHYSGSILYDNERESWSKSSDTLVRWYVFSVYAQREIAVNSEKREFVNSQMSSPNMTRLAGLYLSPRLVPALLYHALSALSTMLICSNGLQHVRTAYLFLNFTFRSFFIFLLIRSRSWWQKFPRDSSF